MSYEFITTDSEMIYDEVLTMLESGVSEPLYPGDERRIFGEALVPLFVGLYNAMNDAARQKMLRFARGEVLDALGERVGVVRMPATEATTVLRFSIAGTVGENIIIPAGTRVTSDSARYFATVQSALVETGKTDVEVEAVSVGGGSEYNGIGVGAIKAIVDLIPYVDAVSNLTETTGGEDGESDDNLRERIRTAPSKLTTAGPVKGYRYWAMSADPSIADVTVKSEQERIHRELDIVGGSYAFKGGGDLIPETLVVWTSDGKEAIIGTDYTATYEDDLLTIHIIGGTTAGAGIIAAGKVRISIYKTNAGIVKIVPVCEGGELPSEEILEKVESSCSAAEVRPLTDRVVVEAPSVQEYGIELTYYTTAADESACVQTIEGDGGAIDQFIEWQCSKLGFHIEPDKLRALMLAPKDEGAVGATRVEITSPKRVELPDTVIAKFSGNMTIKHEVVG